MSITFTAAALLLVTTARAAFPDCTNGVLKNNNVCNTSASPLDRATALISLFTIAEKLNNTGNSSPGVPRIGLPPYQWWSEALHGVANSPGVQFASSGDYSYATSFPQPITMGAAFDDQLIRDVGTVVSTEARVFNNAGRAGLDFWTPNINPFKDPRWGRGQETPGEDPYRLSSYVHALIDGLQGGYDPKYKRVVATCKHFAGYDIENWNGNFRYQFDAQISSQDLAEYYMPPFQSCARDSNVGSFMCSYNAVNGVPTCADSYLLQTILREHWGWTNEQQYVTSDCDAVQNIYQPHEYTATREEAVAAALIAGTDLDCGTYYPNYLPAAFEQGLFNESTLDQALIRQYSALVRLGYFDPPEEQPYRQLSFNDVSTPEAQKLAYKAAVEGIVLLKNDGLLPLSLQNNSSIALIGSWANATQQMQGNYFGQAPYLHSPLYAAQQLGITISYAQGVSGQRDPTTDNWLPVWTAASKSDIIIFADGIDDSVESEGMDRAAQLDMIGQLASYGKPMIVLQMGGGQIDSSPIKNNPNISALIWGGYPGQDWWSPAGRLPTTQYPASYVNEVPMTDMSLHPGPHSPGRTYKWYNGTPIYDFGTGLHYTNFSASITSPVMQSYEIAALTSNCTEKYLDRCFLPLLAPLRHTSDYKSLVAYQRLFDIAGGAADTARLNLTLGSLARYDEQGNRVLYPGDYAVVIDTAPLAMVNFTLTGEQRVLEEWPQPPGRRGGSGVEGLEGYFVGGYGSGQGVTPSTY
ncbi:glycoside hydrolase superfamily [Desarmillaria tabescens]|uniref:xylan 1,4-beta-xylosidase n=1 Tax=Armillaria tabescens TaxID=1929756 RepID=A0AA39TQ87_ARMTA|nr:glycoside hydrolase superfamily [Desarmillaria tabescens]KAK0466722.1 glycoside hydrolase superfamily [Desarmillaria tabescens]